MWVSSAHCLLDGDLYGHMSSAIVGGVDRNVVFLLIAGIGSALACGLGAVPVFLLGDRINAWRPALWGLAGGLMAAVSVEALLWPALRLGGIGQSMLGLLSGIVFVLISHWLIRHRDLKAQGLREADARRSALIFVVLFVHSLPEGMAMGAAQASALQGLNIIVILAIALHHVPEGAMVAIPMASAGFGKRAQFWTAVLTSVPQPISAPIAYALVDHAAVLLPASLAFAGGAMLATVALELVPEALSVGMWRKGVAGILVGVAIIVVLGAILGVWLGVV